MTRLTHNVLAACAAFVLSIASIGAIVTIPPAQSEGSAALALLEIA
jgi:hypothetical protein